MSLAGDGDGSPVDKGESNMRQVGVGPVGRPSRRVGRLLVALALLVSATVALVSRETPADAKTHGKGNVILFVHGYQALTID